MAYWSKVRKKLGRHSQAFWTGSRPNSQVLLSDLIWPAAAGNVGWAVFTTVVQALKEANPNLGEYAGRVVVLTILSIYLGSDWIRTRNAILKNTRAYFTWDLMHITAIAVYAIGVGSDLPLGSLYHLLGIVFILTACGHLFGAWRIGDNDRPRLALALANLSGILVLLPTYSHPSHLWCALAIGVVLLFWWHVEYIWFDRSPGGD